MLERGKLMPTFTFIHPINVLTTSRQDLHGIAYGSRYEVDVELPRFRMPERGVEPKAAYQLLHDELLLGKLTILPCDEDPSL
jgi:hypothetical protein